MEVTGRINAVTKDWQTGKLLITFEADSVPSDLPDLRDQTLDITAKKHRNRRSKNANALLWSCIGKIATAVCADKWDIYLTMLKRYGEFTYVCVKPNAVDMLKRQWRECEELGPIMVNGTPAMQMLCYYGSSTYDTRQFTALLEGVFFEMQQMGIETPSEEEMRLSLEAWNGNSTITA